MSTFKTAAAILVQCQPGTALHRLKLQGGVPTLDQISVLVSVEEVPDNKIKIVTLTYNHSASNPGPLVVTEVVGSSDFSYGFYVLTQADRLKLAEILHDPAGYIAENQALIDAA